MSTDRLASPEPDVVSRSGITVDRRRHTVTVQDEIVNLTPSEFRLLETLIRQPGRVFSRVELMHAALGEDALVTERTIDVHIRGLRKKLGEAAQAIATVRRAGYFFRDPDMGSDVP
jgi:two-component system phosphate regulon response regulator PhoB